MSEVTVTFRAAAPECGCDVEYMGHMVEIFGNPVVMVEVRGGCQHQAARDLA